MLKRYTDGGAFAVSSSVAKRSCGEMEGRKKKLLKEKKREATNVRVYKQNYP